MRTYQITVGNKFFWSQVRTNATSPEAAIAAVKAALETPRWIKVADEEYAMDPDNPADREDHTYHCSDDLDYVEELDELMDVKGVELYDSGPNG